MYFMCFDLLFAVVFKAPDSSNGFNTLDIKWLRLLYPMWAWISSLEWATPLQKTNIASSYLPLIITLLFFSPSILYRVIGKQSCWSFSWGSLNFSFLYTFYVFLRPLPFLSIKPTISKQRHKVLFLLIDGIESRLYSSGFFGRSHPPGEVDISAKFVPATNQFEVNNKYMNDNSTILSRSN